MASTDVIRRHARLRLSIRQLFGFKYGGVFTSVDVEQWSDVTRSDLDVRPLNDLLMYPESLRQSEMWLETSSRTREMSLPAISGEEPEVLAITAAREFKQRRRQSPDRIGVTEPGVMSTVAGMASKSNNPATLTPSDIRVGGGRAGEDINHSPFSLSHLSSTEYKHYFVEGMSPLGRHHDISEELSALSLKDNTDSQEPMSRIQNYHTSKNTQNFNPDVANLLETLLKFGVHSQPVQYKEKRFRIETREIFCKNLFLKDRRGQLYLVICDEDKDINLKTLRRKLKAYRNFSFVLPGEMLATLQVNPGGVTPFALMHGTARDVRVAITTDLTIKQDVLLNFHPFDQSLTLPVKLCQLKEFLAYFRYELEVLDMEDG